MKNVFKYILTALCALLLGIGIGLLIPYPKAPETPIMKVSDTIYIHHVDTLIIPQQKLIEVERLVIDTFIIKDTILVREQLQYQDSLSTIVISGIDPKFESIQYYIPRDTIRIDNTETIIQIPKYKSGFTIAVGPAISGGYSSTPSNWGWSVGIGIVVGYGITIK